MVNSDMCMMHFVVQCVGWSAWCIFLLPWYMADLNVVQSGGKEGLWGSILARSLWGFFCSFGVFFWYILRGGTFGEVFWYLAGGGVFWYKAGVCFGMHHLNGAPWFYRTALQGLLEGGVAADTTRGQNNVEGK